ncbi:MAG: hypothetical protein ACRDYU_16415 [Actinomycetes bacterium]
MARAIALPSPEATSPAVTSLAPGRRDLFWTSGGTLRHQSLLSGGSWGRPLDRGGSLASQPAVVSWDEGHLDVFARGTDNRLKWRTRTPDGWSDWTSLGGALTSAPAVASWGPGRLDVFARWTDNALYQRTFANGVWGAWTRRGGTLTSSPAATSWGVGRIDVVARGSGNDLLHRRFTTAGGWASWRNLGGNLSAQPAVAAPVVGRLDVAFRGSGGRMNVRSLVSGAWTSLLRLGEDIHTSGPGAAAIGDDVRVVARRANGFLYEAVRTSPGGSWSGWRIVDQYAPFRGLATWVDTLDYPSLAPTPSIADMQARGVRTLFLSTARFNSVNDFFDETEMGQWLDAAHPAGIKVVGWYVPAYGDMTRDVRRTVAIGDYVSPGGQRFDAVGVDIERYRAPTEPVTAGEVDHATFNASVVPHLEQSRAEVTTPMAAIVPSPFGTEAGNRWSGFPWSGIGPNSEVVVPMLLWSFRGAPGDAWSAQQVYDWIVDQVDTTQALTGRRVHVEGGVIGEPVPIRTPVTQARVQAFVDACLDAGAIGGSQYDYATMNEPDEPVGQWAILAGLN